jgi:hypothetical protein
LVIDVDGGIRTITNRSDIKVFTPRPGHWDDLQRIYDWLLTKRNRHPFKTIGLDSITDVYRIALTNAILSNPKPNPLGVPSQSDYGAANEQTIRMVRAFKEFAVELGWNVIFTAHTREDKDETSGAILTRPAMTPGATLGIVGAVDAVGYLRRLPRSQDRELRLGGSDTITSKYRQPPDMPEALKLPEVIVKPHMHRILSHLKGESSLVDSGAPSLPDEE